VSYRLSSPDLARDRNLFSSRKFASHDVEKHLELGAGKTRYEQIKKLVRYGGVISAILSLKTRTAIPSKRSGQRRKCVTKSSVKHAEEFDSPFADVVHRARMASVVTPDLRSSLSYRKGVGIDLSRESEVVCPAFRMKLWVVLSTLR